MREKVDEHRIIDDVRTMRALAHPDRVAILLFLLSGDPKTATACAEEIDASPSACSYHLRELERFGVVERAEPSGDGRERPWRATAAGFSVGKDWTDDSLAARAARRAITHVDLEENRRLVQRFLEFADDLDPEWKAAVEFHTFELLATPEELNQLNERVAEILKPFRPTERENVSDSAAPVHVVYQAFPRATVRS